MQLANAATLEDDRAVGQLPVYGAISSGALIFIPTDQTGESDQADQTEPAVIWMAIIVRAACGAGVSGLSAARSGFLRE